MEENSALVEINKAQQALERANDIHEIIDLRDKAMAFQLFANAQGFKDAAQEAKIYQLKAERKAGDWLEENVDHGGGDTTLYQDGTRSGLPEGIDRKESSRWQQEASLPEPLFNDWIDSCLSTGREITASELRRKAEEVKRQESRAALAEQGEEVKPDEHWHIYHADISTWQTDQQYDFIITDPPYPKEYLPLYGTLAERAKEWLKPDGLLIAMCGQSYFDQVINLMSMFMDYYWTACYLLPGQPTPLRQRQVNTSWKPLLIFGNSNYAGKIFGDVFRSDGNDKDFHKWGQSISGMYSIVNQVCLPGHYILDPFCGAGTTGIAALKHGCLFDGIDIDIQNVNIAKARLDDATKTR